MSKKTNVSHTYTYIIRNEGGGSAENNPVTTPPNAPSIEKPKKPKPVDWAKEKAKERDMWLKLGAKAMVAYNQVQSYMDVIYTHQITTIQLRTGQNELQQRAQATYGFLKQGTSIGESIISGTILGGGAGALIGTAVGLARTTIGYVQQGMDLQLQQRLEAVGRTIQLARAGGGNRNV